MILVFTGKKGLKKLLFAIAELGGIKMLFIRSLINLLFIPVVALYFYDMNNNVEMDISFQTLIRYIIFTCFNIPLTRVFTYIIRIGIGMNIEADSSYYTVVALISAMLLPTVLGYGKRLLEIIKEEDQEQGNDENDLGDKVG